jgi:hypothetical protein
MKNVISLKVRILGSNPFLTRVYIHIHYIGCLKIREFRIQSVVGKDPVELEKYLEQKIRSC